MYIYIRLNVRCKYSTVYIFPLHLYKLQQRFKISPNRFVFVIRCVLCMCFSVLCAFIWVNFVHVRECISAKTWVVFQKRDTEIIKCNSWGRFDPFIQAYPCGLYNLPFSNFKHLALKIAWNLIQELIHLVLRGKNILFSYCVCKILFWTISTNHENLETHLHAHQL